MKKVFAVIALVSLQFAMKLNCNAQTGCATQVPNGLMLHLDAAQGYNPATGNWTDQSPRNNNMSLFSGAIPALAIGTNGLPLIRFAANANSMLQNTNLNGDFDAATKTIFIVSTSSTNVQAPISVAVNNTVNNEFLLQGNSVYHHNADAFWGVKSHQCAAILGAPGPKLFTGAWNMGITANDLDFYVNGVLSTSPFTIFNPANPITNYTAFTTPTRRVYIGGRIYFNPYYFAGDIYEILVYDRLLTAAEINTINQCLMNKYNLTGTTPITGPTNVCQNNTITLANATTGGTWSSSNTNIATITQGGVLTGITPGNVVITYTGACTNAVNYTVTVNARPQSNIRDTSICIGDTIQLVASNGTSYSWSPNYNISNTTISNPLVWPTVTTNYIVNITNANGCSTKDTVKVTVSNCHCEDSCSWSLTGNLNVLPRNFIGSINNADFKIRTNNTQRMVVQAGGNVGIGTTNPGKLLEVNGEARIIGLMPALPNESLVFANGSGDLHKLNASGNTNQYLGGDGTWHNMPSIGGSTGADQGLTIDGTTVVLGDDCNKGGGQFRSNREINMNDLNLYFNSAGKGKLYMGNTGQTPVDDCLPLYTRLEISSNGLRAENSYASPDPSTSGLRFSNLTSETEPIDNRSPGVLSLDKDGDVIWVKSCCPGTGGKDAQINDILERLTKLENELKASKEEAAALKAQITQMDILLSQKNTIVLNQNIPNPFEENTVITYMIPKNFREAQIIFTSITGEVIKTAEIKQAGKGQVNVFAKDISKGVYTYTLIVDGKPIDTKKMVKQ